MQGEQDLCFGPHRLDLEAGQLWRDQEQVKLTPKALAVLRVLVAKAEQVVTKEELFQTVWPQTVVSDDALTTCILELRHALRDNAKQPTYIETVHRRGYRFIAPLATTPPVASRQSSVVSQTEGASSQYSAVSSQQKNNQRAKDGEIKEAEGWRLKASRLPPVFLTDSLLVEESFYTGCNSVVNRNRFGCLLLAASATQHSALGTRY